MLSSAEKTTVQHVACASKVGSVELDSVPASHAAGLQNIEFVRISQEVSERYYNLLAIGEASSTSEMGPGCVETLPMP
jgi:hypothetical protein